MQKNITVIVLVALTLFLIAQTSAQILPPPQSVELTPGSFSADSIRLQLPLIQERKGLALEEVLVGLFQMGSPNTPHTIRCSLDKSTEKFNHPEGYQLNIKSDQVTIEASHAKGLFYGLQSLAQLKRYHGKESIPCQIINDWPTLAHRVVMDDISRGPIPSNAFIKNQIKRLARYKINALTFYIEDVVRVPSHPTFAPRHAISVEEFSELSEFAARYNVELIGSFQSLGHFDKILKFPLYQELGISSRMLDPTSPKSRRFLLDVYDDMYPQFSSKYFNINGDEAWDLSRGRLAPLADSIGAGSIYSNHITPLLDHLGNKGKTPLLWADILLEHPEQIEAIPDHTILLPWEYSALDDFSPWLDPLKDGNHEFWVCPGILNSNRFMPDLNMAADNSSGFIRQGITAGTNGMILTVWDDGGRHFFHRDWLGVAHAASHAWHKQLQMTKEEIDSTWCVIESPSSQDEIVRGIMQLHTLRELRSTQNFTSNFLTQVLIPNPGETLTLTLNESSLIENTIDLALEHFRSDPKHPDAPYWIFTAEELKEVIQSKQKVIDWANTYRELSVGQMGSTNIKIELQQLIDEIQQAQEKWMTLHNSFTHLWDLENRPHWRTEAQETTKNRINKLIALAQRLSTARNEFSPAQNIYLPSPELIGLEVVATSDNYFNYWLLNGPHRFESFIDSLPDFLADSGGEKQISPSAGQISTSEQGEFMWTKHQSALSDQIDLRKYYGELKGSVAYAYAEVTSLEDVEVLASIGSNDGLTLFINGEEKYRFDSKRSLQPDEDTVKLNLKKGTNHLMLKISQWKGAWGFSFRLLDQKVQNRKHRYELLNDE